jgi:single-strand DNA-binding protein
MSKIKMTVIGNLGRDAEVKTMNDGVQLITFSLAINEKNAKGEETTTWVSCSQRKKAGESVRLADYLKKGTQVYVEGKPYVSSYAANDGTTKFSLNLLIREIELLGGKAEGVSGNDSHPISSNNSVPDSMIAETDDLPF